MYTGACMNLMAEMQIQDPVLGEIVRRLVDDCQPVRIYLFGSRARGNAGADSSRGRQEGIRCTDPVFQNHRG